jgi:hypothetical protein
MLRFMAIAPSINALQIVTATTAVNCIRPQLYRKLLRPPDRNAARGHNSRDVDEDTGPVRPGRVSACIWV